MISRKSSAYSSLMRRASSRRDGLSFGSLIRSGSSVGATAQGRPGPTGALELNQMKARRFTLAGLVLPSGTGLFPTSAQI